jgi:hypothetical protein
MVVGFSGTNRVLAVRLATALAFLTDLQERRLVGSREPALPIYWKVSETPEWPSWPKMKDAEEGKTLLHLIGRG